MDINEELGKLFDSDDYRDYKKKYTDSYLVHVFFSKAKSVDIIEAGYYNIKDGSITSFKLGKEILLSSTEMPLKDNNSKSSIKELDLKKVNYGFNDALSAALKLQKEKYPKESALKEIIVLQDLGDGPLYNITFITSTFKTLNIKINAKTLDTLSHDLVPLIQFSP